MPWLGIGFFITALLYASIGFGGGSTYTALLALSGTSTKFIPAISLMCNIVVVTAGTIRFAQNGLMPWKRALPLALIAAPITWLAAKTPIKEATFLGLLSGSLFVVGLILLLQKESAADQPSDAGNAGLATYGIAAGAGLLAGFVGIGGGIFLAPWLHFRRWAAAREIAATASLFILINSISGLIGQAQKLSGSGDLDKLVTHWPLAASVFVGGLIGNHLGIRLFSPALLKRLTALLILYVSIQLGWKLLNG